MNYLELVNKALDEAGQSLDPLTSTNFANPSGSKMYLRFKSWVAEAWEEIQTESKDAFFSSAVVVTSLRPRIRVYDLFAVTAIGGKSYYDTSNNLIEVVASKPAISGDATLGTYSGFLDIVPADGDYDKLEVGSLWTEDTLDPTPNTFKLSSFVGYGIDELDSRIQTLTNLPIILKVDNQEHTVQCTSWKEWRHPLKGEYGIPTLYTIGPDGYLYFYPNLAEDATLIAYGNTKPQLLALYSDTPSS